MLAVLVLGVVLVLAVPGCVSTSNETALKPNLMFILVDDWGWANLGIHNPGNPEVTTPNLDALINDGILLDRHYVYKVASSVYCTLVTKGFTYTRFCPLVYHF
jgi:arylsulfatase B